MRLLYDGHRPRLLQTTNPKYRLLAQCMRGSTYDDARFSMLVSWNVLRPISDRRQDAAELSIGPCALVWKDIPPRLGQCMLQVRVRNRGVCLTASQQL